MPKHFDVIVIGVGGMGSAACYHLARRGVRVLGIEQFAIPHTLGSSHGHSRMIRSAYYEHADYVPLLKRAFELWRELQQLSTLPLFHVTGGLYMGGPDGEMIAGSLASSRQHGLPHELLDRSKLSKRYPQFHVPDDFVALFEHEAGFIVPELAIAAHVNLAMRHGAEIHGNEALLSWTSDASGVCVITSRGQYTADEIIFSGGAWSSKLIKDLGVPLLVTRQVMGWVQTPKPDPFALGIFPVWAVDNADGTLHYGFPLLPETPGLKIAHHGRGSVADPDSIDRQPRAEDENTFRPALRRILPDANGPTVAMRICMYTNSPDGHFIVDRHPLHPRATLACGFSGHGFKFASVMGEVLADLAMRRESAMNVGFLGLKRFGANMK